LLVIVAAAGLLGTLTAQRGVDRVFDHWLLDSAHALAAQVKDAEGTAKVDLSGSAAALLAFDEIDQTWYDVIQGGRLVVGTERIPDAGERQTTYPNGRAFDAWFDGRRVRVAAFVVCATCAAPVSVHVAETTRKRDGARADVLWMVLPLVVLLIAAVLTIVAALRRTLLPLERMAAIWNEQSSRSLEPIGTAGVPRELLPFAAALNQLLGRIRAMLARERQFAATAAHQLRTPLTALQLGLARAAEAPDIDSARTVIAELNRGTQRTARLIQQLLAIGSLDPEARGELAFVPTDLVGLARDVGSAYLDAAQSRSIDLELNEPPMAVVAAVNADLIGEALGNLVDNALRHTPQGGRVVIELDRRETPSISVCDSGPGFDPAIRANIFERFVRGRRGGGEGSGLGLAIVRDIARLHGATVECERSTLGGARVTMTFVGEISGVRPASAA
jgi:two-component system sensor histidine kinase TctE